MWWSGSVFAGVLNIKREKSMKQGLTTVKVPTISRGGSMLLSTSWLTKWAVMPTMAIMATMLRPREMRKVFANGAEEAMFAERSGVWTSLGSGFFFWKW